jgi:hypothetical protein
MDSYIPRQRLHLVFFHIVFSLVKLHQHIELLLYRTYIRFWGIGEEIDAKVILMLREKNQELGDRLSSEHAPVKESLQKFYSWRQNNQ